MEDLARAMPGVRTSEDPADRVAYARDLWPRHHLAVRAGVGAQGTYEPGAIVWPESTEDVERIVAFCFGYPQVGGVHLQITKLEAHDDCEVGYETRRRR